MRFVRSLIVVGAICASTSMARAQAIDWQKIDDAFGRKAAVISGDAHRYGFPRTDLSVTLDGVAIKPALALGVLPANNFHEAINVARSFGAKVHVIRMLVHVER